MSEYPCWDKGSQIVYREIWRGNVWTARPVTVVRDTPELIALYLCAGTRWKVCTPPDASTDLLHCKLPTGTWQLADATWQWGDTLYLLPPGGAHAVHVMWGREDRSFVGWYVNLQEPVRRTALGFDFMDQDLDIVVKPDLSGWFWKDEATFAEAQKIGLLSGEQAREIRAEGERVIARICVGVSPFGDGWEHWLPPPGWSVPELLEGWDRL